MRIVLACLVALAVPTGLTACGTETDAPSASGHWVEQRLAGVPGGDRPVGFAADGDDVLVVVLDEHGTLRSHLSENGGEFRAGPPLDTDDDAYSTFVDPVRFDGGWWLFGSGGRTGEGNDETLTFEPMVLRSDDGLAWESVDVSGIPAPVDLNAVGVADGEVVVVGDKRNEVDTGGASFEAAVWRSEDGAAWTEVPLPGVVNRPSYRDASVAAQVTVVDGTVLAGGQLGQRAALWSSTDAGRTWARVESPEVEDLAAVNGLVSKDSTVLVSGPARGEDSGGRFLRSDDGGVAFAPTVDQPAEDAEGGYARLWAGGGRFFTFTEPSFELSSDPAVCYADLELCRGGATSDLGYVHASEDAETWSIVDTTDLGVGDELVGVAGTDEGRVVMAHVVRSGLAVHTWPADAPLPEGEEAAGPRRADLVTVPEGEDPEPGVRYHAPLYVHCGMDWLYLGGTAWQRTDGGPDVETGAGDDGPGDWPLAGQTIFGYATLDDDDDGVVVEYSIGAGGDAEVIATYEQTGTEPPGCA